MKTQYQRCQEFIKAHFGRMKKQEKSLFWQGWQAALGWHGHCKDCRFVKPDFSGCTSFRWEPCQLIEPKDPVTGGISQARGKDKA